jgi:hypothetical protein
MGLIGDSNRFVRVRRCSFEAAAHLMRPVDEPELDVQAAQQALYELEAEGKPFTFRI